VQDTDYLNLDLGYYKKMQISIRENRVVQYDSIWPWADPKEYIFYSVSDTKINFSNATEENSLVLGEFEIAMDNQIGKFNMIIFIDIYERKVYTLFDVFSDIGGAFEMFHVIGIILVATYNKKALKIEIANMMQDQLSDKALDEKLQNNKKTNRRTLPLNNSMAEEEK
jgi:hypothetical protein